MPTYTPTELEALVQRRAPEIARDIRDAACNACNEADLVGPSNASSGNLPKTSM